jgi:hypothetical protein
MAVVTALAASAWFAIPQLRGILLAYIAVNAVTRIAFGAHFPADVLAGVALGYGSALAGRSLFASVSTETPAPSADGSEAAFDPAGTDERPRSRPRRPAGFRRVRPTRNERRDTHATRRPSPQAQGAEP